MQQELQPPKSTAARKSLNVCMAGIARQGYQTARENPAKLLKFPATAWPLLPSSRLTGRMRPFFHHAD
ncbi:MAG: hypothetical protein ACLS9G_05740, partial [Akkermansia sp.]